MTKSSQPTASTTLTKEAPVNIDKTGIATCKKKKMKKKKEEADQKERRASTSPHRRSSKKKKGSSSKRHSAGESSSPLLIDERVPLPPAPVLSAVQVTSTKKRSSSKLSASESSGPLLVDERVPLPPSPVPGAVQANGTVQVNKTGNPAGDGDVTRSPDYSDDGSRSSSEFPGAVPVGGIRTSTTEEATVTAVTTDGQ